MRRWPSTVFLSQKLFCSAFGRLLSYASMKTLESKAILWPGPVLHSHPNLEESGRRTTPPSFLEVIFLGPGKTPLFYLYKNYCKNNDILAWPSIPLSLPDSEERGRRTPSIPLA